MAAGLGSCPRDTGLHDVGGRSGVGDYDGLGAGDECATTADGLVRRDVGGGALGEVPGDARNYWARAGAMSTGLRAH